MKEMGFPDFKKLCNYANFVSAWYAFRERLEVDFEGGFVCNEPGCGLSPEIIVCDGTSLGFKRSMLMSTLSAITESVIPIKRKRYFTWLLMKCILKVLTQSEKCTHYFIQDNAKF